MKNKKIAAICIMLVLSVTAVLVASAEEKIDGEPLPPLPNPFRITELKEGWNMVGYPNQGSISKYDISIIYNGETYNWTEAVNQMIILHFIYGWDNENNYYEFADELEGGCGYWLCSWHDCELWSLY